MLPSGIKGLRIIKPNMELKTKKYIVIDAWSGHVTFYVEDLVEKRNSFETLDRTKRYDKKNCIPYTDKKYKLTEQYKSKENLYKNKLNNILEQIKGAKDMLWKNRFILSIKYVKEETDGSIKSLAKFVNMSRQQLSNLMND